MDTSIWNNIKALQIGSPEASLTFSQRLARENNWSVGFADRVIVEYKRFIYLMAISNQEVTPSDEVDQAWHLHLTYTRSYWDDLCGDILGFSLHHNPTKGGLQEQDRFRAQYQYTLSLYEETFGHKPPTDIWPTVDNRFADVEEFVRINRSHSFLFPKPALLAEKLLFLICMPLVLAACTAEEKEQYLDIGLVVLGIYLLYRIFRWALRQDKKSDRGCGGGCGGCGGCGG